MNPNTIPNNVKSLANSAEIFDACERVGKKLGLHIDQIGEVDAQVRAILRGQALAKKLTSDIKKYLEIDDSLAKQITEEVNQEIFQTLRTKMQSQSTPEALTPVNFSPIERAGDLKIEPEATLKTSVASEPDISERDRSRLLTGIEDPLVPVPHYEPLADQLLQRPPSIPEQKAAPAAPIKPPLAPFNPKPLVPKPPASLPRSSDPYREPIA